VHDAVRPCTDAASLLRLRTELADDRSAACSPCRSRARSSGGRAQRSARTVRREGLWQAQTPQMFRYAVLRRAFAQAGVDDVTDESQAVERLGLAPRLVAGSRANLKVTFAEDLALAAAILAVERETARRSA
jgi:2-C-methyl-D-erythritol 4-phosphate cytidylyltransferase